ncbi:hypothetical protein D3C79_1070590 [compost metagenome]
MDPGFQHAALETALDFARVGVGEEHFDPRDVFIETCQAGDKFALHPLRQRVAALNDVVRVHLDLHAVSFGQMPAGAGGLGHP